MKKIYLAGPDVFDPNHLAIGKSLKQILLSVGLVGLFPMDAKVQGESTLVGPGLAAAIFEANVAMIDEADGVLANFTPFRGPSADAGTCWEVGYAYAKGKPVVAYTPDPGSYIDRMRAMGLEGTPGFDRNGLIIEDFGGVDNLMLTASTGLEVSHTAARVTTPDEIIRDAALRLKALLQ